MDPPRRGFAVTAEAESTVFHHGRGSAAQSGPCVCSPFTRHYWPSNFRSIVPGSSILSTVSLSQPCQKAWADYGGMLMLIKLALMKIHAAWRALISQMDSLQGHEMWGIWGLGNFSAVCKNYVKHLNNEQLLPGLHPPAQKQESNGLQAVITYCCGKTAGDYSCGGGGRHNWCFLKCKISTS